MVKVDYTIAQVFGYLYGMDNINDPNERIIVMEPTNENAKLRASGAHEIDYLMGEM